MKFDRSVRPPRDSGLLADQTCYSARDRVLGAPGPSSVPDGRVVRLHDPWPTPQVSPGASRVGALRTRITTYGREPRDHNGLPVPVRRLAMVRRMRAPPGPSDPAALRPFPDPADPPHVRRCAIRTADRRLSRRPRTARYAQAMTRSTRAWLEGASRASPAPHRCRPFPRHSRRPRRLRQPRSPSCPSIPPRRARPTGASRAPTPSSRPCCPRRTTGRRPTRVDSGRNCTAEALGTLADDGITGVEFAGATWEPSGTIRASRRPCSRARASSPKELFTFYRESGGTDRHTEKMSTSDVTVAGQERPPARHPRDRRHRPDGRGLAADQPDTVFVLLAADVGDAAVPDALGQFAGT